MFRNILNYIIKKNPHNSFWYWISSNPNLEMNAIYNNLDKVDFYILSANPNLDLEFIEKYKDLLDWTVLANSSKYIKDLIEKYPQKILNTYFSLNPYLDEELINTYKNNINWNDLYIGNKIVSKLDPKYLESADWEQISLNRNLTVDFIKKYKNKLNFSKLKSYTNLDLDFIEKYLDKILAEDLDFINANQDFINWNWMAYNYPLSIEFIEQFKHKLKNHWHIISNNPSLTIEIIEKYCEEIHWYLLSANLFNSHPVIFERNKKIYSKNLKDELIQYLDIYHHKKWKNIFSMDVIHLLNLRIRDLENGLRNNLIDEINLYGDLIDKIKLDD